MRFIKTRGLVHTLVSGMNKGRLGNLGIPTSTIMEMLMSFSMRKSTTERLLLRPRHVVDMSCAFEVMGGGRIFSLRRFGSMGYRSHYLSLSLEKSAGTSLSL